MPDAKTRAMRSRYTKTVITFTTTKQAALYFEKVIPMGLPIEYVINKKTSPESHRESVIEHAKETLAELLPKELLVNPKFFNDLGNVYLLISRSIVKRLKAEKADSGAASVKDMDDRDALAFVKLLRDFDLKDIPIDWPPDSSDTDPNGDPVIVLSGIPLVDVTNVSWRQVLEFRSDKHAQEKLRRLRLFAYAHYRGKPRSFIEDDLLRRIDEHHAAVRKWGFETKSSAINMVLSSKTGGAALAGSFAATLFGTPIAGLAALAGAAFLEVGRVSLYIAKRNFALQELLNNNPVSYIEHARSRLSGCVG
jgi:hypothetical protein